MERVCIEKLYSMYPPCIFDFTINPCSRDSKFLDLVVGNKIGIDIKSDNSDVVNIDYFDYYPEIGMKILVLCKPPLKRCVDFFNYSSRFADVIAIVVPTFFRSPGVQNSLNLNFDLEFDIDLYDDFCFQIWERIDFTLK